MGGPLALFLRDAETEEHRQLIGPFFVGMILNYLLWGIQISQTYFYYKTFRETDRTWFKGGVIVLFVLDGFQSITATQGIWHFMVEGWGNPNPAFTPFSSGFILISAADAILASVVHVLYAQKIWVLLQTPYNTICTIIVLVLSTCQLAGGLGCTGLAFAIDVTLVNFIRIKTWSIIWLVSASITDILITALMSWRLSKSRTGFKRTDDIISKLIRSTVETGLAPAIIQTVDLIVFLIWPMRSYHVTLTLLTPKVYSNSMMALLNSRRPSKPNDVWGSTSGQDVPVDSIQIRTTQTVNVSGDDFELTPNMKRDFPGALPSPRMQRDFSPVSSPRMKRPM